MEAARENHPANRLGIHYFPDARHYRASDLRAWLPELQALGVRWLVLVAPPDRAIPEAFLKELLAVEIEPVLRFPLPLTSPITIEELQVLLDSYGRWGVRYAAFFDRPNRRRSWKPSAWAHQDLVERFVDLFLPLAEGAVRAGIQPLFPPLEPGGDYWDTAFLRSGLQALRRRASRQLLDHLGLGAYAWANGRPLNWGAGGPERWPGARPYVLSPQEEDHRGFRIFDWYLALADAALGRRPPLFLLGVGEHLLGPNGTPEQDIGPVDHTARTLEIARLLEDGPGSRGSPKIESLPAEVAAVNFWLLAAEAASPFHPAAWFKADGSSLPIVGAIRQWRGTLTGSPNGGAGAKSPPAPTRRRPIAHYLLLPSYEWGVSDWHLKAIQPFVKEHRPTVGFSLVEAGNASRVTVFGGPDSFPEAVLDDLRSAGCKVERIVPNGMGIAP